MFRNKCCIQIPSFVSLKGKVKMVFIKLDVIGLLSHCYLAGERICQCGQLRQFTTMTEANLRPEAKPHLNHACSGLVPVCRLLGLVALLLQICYIILTVTKCVHSKGKPVIIFPEKTQNHRYSTM